MNATVTEALEVSIDLWTWLADNPTKKKYEWPRYEEIEKCLYQCSLCSIFYNSQHNECPLNLGAHGLHCGYECAAGWYEYWRVYVDDEPDAEKASRGALGVLGLLKEALQKAKEE